MIEDKKNLIKIGTRYSSLEFEKIIIAIAKMGIIWGKTVRRRPGKVPPDYDHDDNQRVNTDKTQKEEAIIPKQPHEFY